MKEIYSYNKWVNTLYTAVMSLSYIPPKCMKTREPKDKYCVLQCTYISDHIHDPIPLNNLNNHTALPYITRYRFHVMQFHVNLSYYECYKILQLINKKVI